MTSLDDILDRNSQAAVDAARQAAAAERHAQAEARGNTLDAVAEARRLAAEEARAANEADFRRLDLAASPPPILTFCGRLRSGVEQALAWRTQVWPAWSNMARAWEVWVRVPSWEVECSFLLTPSALAATDVAAKAATIATALQNLYAPGYGADVGGCP